MSIRADHVRCAETRPIADPAAWYASRPWTRSYPAWLPATLAIDPAATGYSMLCAACARFGARAAFEHEGRTLAFSQWLHDAQCLARYWLHRTELQPGDRVFVLMRNRLEFPVAMFAAWIAGLVVVPLSVAATSHELAARFRDARPACIVGDAALLVAFRAAIASGMAVPEIAVGAQAELPAHALAWNEALRIGAQLPHAERPPRHVDVALLQFTGGTTGLSKAVITTHRNLVAQVGMMRASFSDRIEVARDLVLGAHPCFHSLAISMNLMQFASNGATVLLFSDPCDYAHMAASIATRAVNHIVGGPSLYYGLLGAPEFATRDFSALRGCFVGGMALRPDMRARWESLAGIPMTEGYGLTEVAGGCVVQVGNARRAGSVGVPCPSLELTVRDREGRDLAPGSAGEICLRGPCVMEGYYGRPEDTVRALDADGWLRTGDIGRVDADGYVYLLDRIKDVIVSVVDNIYPAEVEAVVGAHPGVADVCAVAMPDPELEEAVRLIVVRSDPTLCAQALSDWCAERLSAFKRPREIEFRDALPRSAVGKVLRRELRDRRA